MTTRLYLIRHAEAEGNVLRRFQGHWDSNLTEKGLLQLEYLRERFKDTDIDAAFSSDLKRAKVTCEYAVWHSGADIVLDERFREINCGDWENADVTHIKNTCPEDYFKFHFRADLFKMPNGESFVEVAERMQKGIDECVRKNPGKTILIASHGGAIRAYMCKILGISLSQIEKVGLIDNTSVSIIEYDENFRPDVICMNDTAHLPDEIMTDEGMKKYAGQKEI